MVLKPNYIYSVSWFHFVLMLLLCVFLMSRTIYQNLVTARIAKLDIYLLLRSLQWTKKEGGQVVKGGEASAKYRYLFSNETEAVLCTYI